MRSHMLLKALGAAALSLFALTALAVQTGVQVSGVNPGDIASGTISFGNQPAQALVNRDDCETQKTEGESCDRAFLWFAKTNSAPAVGTSVKVTLTDRKGDTTTGTGTVTENGVRVSVPAFPPVEPPPSTSGPGSLGYYIGVGYDEQTLPADNGGLGIRFVPGTPGSEQFILQSRKKVEGESGGIRINTPFGPTVVSRQTYLGLMAYYGNWDVDESAVFPTGTESRGWAYQVESASNGSTGLGFPGSVALDLVVDNNIERWGFGVDLMTVPTDNGVSFGAGLMYEQTTQDIVNRVTAPAFTAPNFVGAETIQEVRDRTLLVPITLRRTWNQNGGMSPYVQAMLAPGYYDSDLSGIFESTCSLCPAAEQVVTQTIDDSDSGFTWEAGVGLGIDFRIGKRFVIGPYAQYGYSDHHGYADNRESPLDDPAHQGDDNADFWAAGVRFGVEVRD